VHVSVSFVFNHLGRRVASSRTAVGPPSAQAFTCPFPEGVTTPLTPTVRSGMKRCRPRRGEARAPAKASPMRRPLQQNLAQMIEDLSTACDHGIQCNAPGYKIS